MLIVSNKEFNGCNSSFVRAGTDKFVLLDLESIFRSDANNYTQSGVDDESDALETVDTPEPEPNLPFPLPNRSVCNPHTLSLVGKNDLFEALSNEDFANNYFEAFERVNQLWNEANKSNRNVGIVKQLIGKKLHKPHRLRWNRIYDSVSFSIILKTFLRIICLMHCHGKHLKACKFHSIKDLIDSANITFLLIFEYISIINFLLARSNK